MTVPTDVREVIETVVKRARFLDRLVGGPTAKRDLRDELEVSRSTVYKAVRELEDAGMVEQTAEGCRLTLFGRLLIEQYRRFSWTVSGVQRHEPLLDSLPPDCPMTAGVLVDAEYVLAERHAPNRPIGRIEELVRRADEVWAMTPVVVPQYVDLYYEAVVERDTVAEVVLETPVVDYLRADHGESFAEAIATGRLAVWELEGTLPFGLVVSADELAVVVYTDAGELAGLIVNDTPVAVEWGRETFRRYRGRAARLASA